MKLQEEMIDIVAKGMIYEDIKSKDVVEEILKLIKNRIPKEKELPPIDDNKLYELTRQRIIGFNSAIDLFKKELL